MSSSHGGQSLTAKIIKMIAANAKAYKQIAVFEGQLSKAITAQRIAYLHGQLKALKKQGSVNAHMIEAMKRKILNRKLSAALAESLDKIMGENEQLRSYIKCIKINLAGKRPIFKFEYKRLTDNDYIVIIGGLLPIFRDNQWQREQFMVSIDGGQNAAKFVANLHNALINLRTMLISLRREKTIMRAEKVIDLLETINDKTHVSNLPRRQYLYDMTHIAGRYEGLFKHLIIRYLPDGWRIKRITIKGSTEHKNLINKLKMINLRRKVIQRWLAGINYHEEVAFTKQGRE